MGVRPDGRRGVENPVAAGPLNRIASRVRSDPVRAYRLGLTIVLGCYLVSIVLTGFVPLSPALDVPFALTGWVLFAFPMVFGLLRRREYRTNEFASRLLHPAPLAGLFALVVLISSYFALAWHLPQACHGISANCFKGYDWSAQGDQFYHVPVDGVRAPISVATYIAEVGVHLRSAAAFGIFSLCFAWAAAAALQPRGDRLAR